MRLKVLKELSNDQIEKYYMRYPKWGGTFSRDDLPNKIANKFYIVNLDSEKGKGTHWVMVSNLNPSICTYFDSFGVSPPPEILHFMKTSGKECVYNTEDLQAYSSDACGWYCMYVADQLLKGRPLQFILDEDFTLDPEKNEHLLQVYMKHGIRGRGVLSKLHNLLPNFIKNRIHIKPKETETNRFKKFIDAEGNKEIKSIKVGEQPVVKPVQQLLNALSFGQYNKKKKQLGYKDVHHRYLVVTLADGKTYKIEKNHVVEAKPTKASDGQYHIPVNKQTTNLKHLIDNAKKDDPQFWKYDAKTNNCQHWVDKVVKKNHLTPSNHTVKKTIEPQNSKELMSVIPKPLQGLPKLATDLAGTADAVIHGGKVKGKKGSGFFDDVKTLNKLK